jgi:hypothetical protein
MEHAAARAALPQLAGKVALALAVHDDELRAPRIAQPVHPLSRLIGEPCPYQARTGTPDPDACSLLRLEGDGSLRRLSLRQLASAAPRSERDIHRAVFDADVFGPVVLPALCAGDTLTWC